MKANKLGRIVLSFALSAVLMAEPLAGMSSVYAQETRVMSQTDIEIDDENPEDQGSDDSGESSAGQDTDSAGENTENRNPDDGGGSPEDQNPDDDGGNPENPENGSGDENTEDSNVGDRDGNLDDSQTEEGNGSDDDLAPGEEIEVSDDQAADDADVPDDEEENPDADANSEDTLEGVRGFSDMPDGYRLTSYQRQLKAELKADLGQIRESDEGVTYATRRVYTFAKSQEEAAMIAEAYHAEIEDFTMGVLTLKLSEDKTVRAAVIMAASMDNSLPAVWPDYRRLLYGEILPETDQTDNETVELEVKEEEYNIDEEWAWPEAGDEIPAQEAYGQALNALSGFQDPYLNPGNDRYQWFHTTIGSTYAWTAGYTGQSVTVGVIDTGVSPNPDLNDNLIGGYNFCDDTSDTDDCYQHGTHVAGTIAALANGSEGVGVAPDAKIYNAKVYGDDGSKSGYDSTIIKAILYLINEEDNSTQGANSETPRVDIINMSLGGSGDTIGFQSILDKAWEKGVIVFAATGNDGASTMMYPASYEHVIAVTATDTNNERAYFSNYGYETDLAAPGVDIWATNVDEKGNAVYESMMGTSMACPVAVGEAAVILSGQDELPSLQGKTGAERVDALEAIMKENAISAGAGMGAGITSLTQVFDLTTAAMKPNAPNIKIVDNSDQTGQSVEVTITAQAGMRLCYTINGKNPVYKNEAAGSYTTLVDSNTVSFMLDGSQAVTGTVKAFAISADGVISAVKSARYRLSPYVKEIVVSGPAKVERGKSIQLSATVAPTYAVNRKVTWNLRSSADEPVDTAKIKISGKGKITVAGEADLGDYTVIVRSEDGGNVEARYAIQVVEKGTAVTSLTFDTNITKTLWLTKAVPAPTVNLADGLTVKEKDASGNVLEFRGDKLEDRVIWASSKPAIAEVDSEGVVTAKSAGAVTITAKANDNSNKKTSVKITVKQGVTGITITTAKGQTDPGLFTVAAGRSMTLKASISPAKPANKKVEWSINPSSDVTTNETNGRILPDVTINKTSGRISVRKDAASGDYTVTAMAADGKGATAQQQLHVYGGAIGKIKLDISKATLYMKEVDDAKTDTQIITATITGADERTDFDPNAYTVTSSNTSIVKVSSIVRDVTTTDAEGKVLIQITLTSAGEKYGKAKVTIASIDGSNKKAVCNVTVKGGIRSVGLQDTAGKKASSLKLFRAVGSGAPEAAMLKPVINGSDGANPVAYEVISSNPTLVKVSVDKEKNEILVSASDKSTGKATITLKATDGSGKKASCSVTVNNPVSRINIAPKAGTTRYVVPGKSVQLTATVETEYGKVTNKNVAWKLSDNALSMDVDINSSGKVTVPSNLAGKSADFTVTATAGDGSGIKASYTIRLRPPTTHFVITTEFPKDNTYDSGEMYVIEFTSDCASQVSCTSSAPEIAAPSIAYTPYNPQTKKGGTGDIMFQATGTGEKPVIFTIKALDTSERTCKIKCTFKIKDKRQD